MSAEAYKYGRMAFEADEGYGYEGTDHEAEPNVINIKRNPYLVDYEQQRRLRGRREQGASGRTASQEVRRVSQRASRAEQGYQGEREVRRQPRVEQGYQEGSEARRASRAEQGYQGEREIRRSPRVEQGYQGEREVRRASRAEQGYQGEREVRRASRAEQGYQEGSEARRASRVEQGYQEGSEARRASRVRQGYQGEREVRRVPRAEQGYQEGREVRRAQPSQGRGMDLYTDGQSQKNRAALARKRAAVRRKRIVKMQRMVLFVGVFCIALLCGILSLKRLDAKNAEPENKGIQNKISGDILPVAPSSGLVQGISEEKFAKHPDWEEKFLTPNEYSRPGEALEEVKNIFVHYTANPNTSAAQNRSYFEQLKDTHITSASAHFIIGYNGEIIQCVPLDEIAYAVQTRNYDSISIECCYKSKDGSFTQETYDSLIELLAWLTDVYDLTTDDILRHYDCGGKKCPIYYTEHEDAWEILKDDVAEKL